MARWHKRLTRLSKMDWGEVRTRVGQEAQKRSDLLRYRLGMRPDGVRVCETAASEGQFFFARTEVVKRGELLHAHLPEEATEIVRAADRIYEHRFHLLGYQNLDHGSEIDWHQDRAHGKRAPHSPWFKIPFLDFSVVGDHKVVWELNRHQHLVTLAKAWLLTKDERYAGEIFAQWRSWVKANPYPIGINWASTLEVAFRSLSWIWLDHLLSDAVQYAEWRAELLSELAVHGHYIERYLSTYFSANTHLLGEAATMFFLGALYPQMPHARRWKQDGWKIVLHEAGRQVRPDGVHFEQSLYYHVYALDFFLYARMLAAQNDLHIPADYDGVLLRMLRVVEVLARAGPAEGFGDDDGGRLFDPTRNCTEHMTDPLAIGALVYGRDGLTSARLTEEAIWLFGERAVTELTREGAGPTFESVAFPDGGFYVLADSQPYAQTLVVDAGPQGEGNCGHGHADALSLRFTMQGDRWLVDAGSGVYTSADRADRNAFRGTAAHNTMLVDRADQAVPGEMFSWTEIPTTQLESWIKGKTFTYFSGSHNGYTRLSDPVTHRRSVLKISRGIWLVRDAALGSEEHDLELNWHFASDLAVRESQAGRFVISRLHAKPEDAALTLIVPAEMPWKNEITRAVVSPAYGRLHTAPVVRSEARLKLPAEVATALIADSAASRRFASPRFTSGHQGAVRVYELSAEDESQGFFFALGKEPWRFGPWSSDADVLYCRMEHDRLTHLVVIGGSSVNWHGERLLTASTPFAFFEWRKEDGILGAESAPFQVSSLFQELTGGALPLASTKNLSSYAERP